jgi:small conductance mechanosensitive channel
MEQRAGEIADVIVALLTTYGLKVLGAIAILIIGWIIAGILFRWTGRALRRVESMDAMLVNFIASIIKYTVIAFTILAVLAQFGVQTASLIAIFGAAGLAIGLALQGTLTNVAAGVMLLILRPFKSGDYIDAGSVAGTVNSVNFFTTELTTPDNVQIIVPNAQLWNSAIRNFSHHSTRRLDLTFGIAYEDKIGAAMDEIRNALDADERCLKDPAPTIAVMGLGDSSVNIVVRVWCATSDYWPLNFDLLRGVKERFDKSGITIPYPQRVVHSIPAEAAD